MSTSPLIEDCKKALNLYNGKWNEKKGLWAFSAVIAERKTFLSRKKLTYCVENADRRGAKLVKFSEMLDGGRFRIFLRRGYG